MCLARLLKAVLLGVFISTMVIGARPERPAGPPNGYIVQVSEGADPLRVGRGVVQRTGGEMGHVYRSAVRGFSVKLPRGIALAAIKAQPGILHIEPDVQVHAVAQFLPTGIDRIDVEKNTTANIDSQHDPMEVDIAIIDTGIDLTHPDLRVVGGRHFYSVLWWSYEDDLYNDDNGHGSHCAGIAAARDNEEGVVGVAPGARLWAVKVLDSSGSGYLSDVIAGVDWVTARADTIEVANMSLAATASSSIFRAAIANSVNAGVVHMVAAGNDATDIYGGDGVFGTSDDIIPASYPEAAAISAMVDLDGLSGGLVYPSPSSYGEDDSFTNFSNYSASVVSGNPVSSPGAAIDLLMPGVNIYSCSMNGGYAVHSGTSMASPHAAGLAALYIAASGRATSAAGVYAIRQALIDAGVAQTDARGLAHLNDPDGNMENIGWAGSSQTEPPVLVSVEVSPVSATIQESETQQYTAIAVYSDSSQTNVTGLAGWDSSSISVATINSSGLATGGNAGSTTITAVFDGVVSNGAILTVTEPVALESVLVTPEGAEITVGDSRQYTATARYSDNSERDVSDQAAWFSSDPKVATIDSLGLATGEAEGTAIITASFGDISDEATLKVTAPAPVTLDSILVEPQGVEITVGDSQQYTATGIYSEGPPADITGDVTWISSDTGVASIDAFGVATGVGEGTSYITATLNGIPSNSAAISVTAVANRIALVSVEVMPLLSFRNWWVATAMVWITEGGAVVPGATIEGVWTGLYNKAASNTTDMFGFISFETKWLRQPGKVTFRVNRVVAPDGQEYSLEPANPSDSTEGP